MMKTKKGEPSSGIMLKAETKKGEQSPEIMLKPDQLGLCRKNVETKKGEQSLERISRTKKGMHRAQKLF
jgi:hypothetical protein